VTEAQAQGQSLLGLRFRTHSGSSYGVDADSGIEGLEPWSAKNLSVLLTNAAIAHIPPIELEMK